MNIPETRGAKPKRHQMPCGICGGSIKTQPDPDEHDDVGQVKDMTFCTGCGEIFSPWTMPYFYKVKQFRDRKGK